MPAPMQPQVMVRQADALAEDLRAQTPVLVERVAGLLTDDQWASVRTVYLTGNGDSHHAALAAAMAFQTLAGLPCRPMPALTFDAYGAEGIRPETGALVIGISASGGSQQVATGLARASANGAITLGVTSNTGSVVAHAAHRTLTVDLPGTEPSPGIRTYQASLLGLLLIAIQLGETRDPSAPSDALRRELVAVADAMDATTPGLKNTCQELAARLAGASIVSVLGSGPGYGTALFAAAKLIEGAGIFAVGQDLEEWRHIDRLAFPLDTPVIVIAPPGRSYATAAVTARDTHRLGRLVVAVVNADDHDVASHAQTVLPVRGAPREEFTPLLYHPFAGYLAASMAQRLGRLPFQGHLS